MTPNELKSATLKQLRETREAMLNLEYLLALEGLSPEQKSESAVALSDIQLAYLTLRNTKIADIRNRLEDNNKDLRNGIKTLKRALKDLSDTQAIIGAAAAFLSVVAKII